MTKQNSKLKYAALFIFCLCLGSLFFNQDSCFAAVQKKGLSAQQLDKWSASNIMFYDPGDCMEKSPTSNSCFKIDSSTSETDFWYAEGCLNNGTCTSGIYAENMSLVMTSNNPFLYTDTKTDDEFGGMQYIYAENYDYDYSGAYTKMTPNGGSSTRKYYWIVLPDKAYSNGLGDTYVATFEKLSEPVYFIVFDVHACQHQSEDYCTQAESDPESVAIGKQFLGAFTKNGGNYSSVASLAGKLTSICRIDGTGEVLAHESGSASVSPSSSSSSSSSSSASASTSTSTSSTTTSTSSTSTSANTVSGSNITWIGDSYSCGALSIIKEKFSGISFGGSECDANSYIMANKGVGDRYGGGTANPPALTILKRVADAGELKPYLVMAVGTNAGWDDSEVTEFKNIMSAHSDTKVVFVNVKAKAHLAADDNKSNDRIKALVDSVQNYYLADWASAYNETYYANNSTHPDANGGYEKWVEVIANALSSIKSGCNSFEGDYPQYFQGNYEKSDHENSSQDWTGITYGEGKVSTSGCGPTSMAMLATVAAGQDIYPQDVIDITKSTGSYTTSSPRTLDPLVGEKYGFEVVGDTYSDKTDAYNKIKDYLNKGYMIHLSGEGEHPGFATYPTPGHYIGLFKIDSSDNVWVANSAFGGNSTVPLQNIIDAIHNGEFTAIKGSGNGGSDCFSYCGGGDNRVGEGGLTIDQAKQFMMNYGENKNDSSKNAVGSLWDFCNGGGSNCVTFSAFFMFKFTNITQNGATGDGQNVVSVLKSRSDVDATYGSEPQIWAIISTQPQHTAVVLGHHDGKWIVGHASCSYNGKGKGNGGNGNLSGDNKGGGSGFIAIEESDDPGEWQWMQPGVEFAYPATVDTAKIEEYLNNGV